MRAQFLAVCEDLYNHQTILAKRMTEHHFSSHPDLEKKYGKSGARKCFEDSEFHICYLVEAVRFANTSLFNTYLQWAAAVLQSRNIPTTDLIANLHFMKSACEQVLSVSSFTIVSDFITSGIEALKNIEPLPETFLLPGNPLQREAKDYLSYLLKGDKQQARVLIDDLLKNGNTINDIYEYIFQNTQYEVGLLWQANRISVADEHYCTAATQSIIASLYKELFTNNKSDKKMLGCAVSGELHELGIRMLTDFFELAGWDTYYLGANMPNANLITAACEQDADLLAISVTSPLNLHKAENLINQLKTSAQLNKMKILVGGYAFNTNPDLWKQIGADGSAENARQAVALAATIVRK